MSERPDFVYITLSVSRRAKALLEYLDMDEGLLLRDLQQVVDRRVGHLAYDLQTEEEGACRFCHASAFWVGHADDCRMNPNNLPEDCK